MISISFQGGPGESGVPGDRGNPVSSIIIRLQTRGFIGCFSPRQLSKSVETESEQSQWIKWIPT